MTKRQTALKVGLHLTGIGLLCGIAGGTTNLVGWTALPVTALRAALLIGACGWFGELWMRDDYDTPADLIAAESRVEMLAQGLFNSGLVVIIVAGVTPDFYPVFTVGTGLFLLGSLCVFALGEWRAVTAQSRDPHTGSRYEVPDDPTEILNNEQDDT